MAKIKAYRYTVRGTGAFPIDMLRYDCAWPCSSGNIDGMRVVTLMSHKEPTAARWASFGWTIMHSEPLR